MKKLSHLLILAGLALILVGTLASCGVLDLTGANARATAQMALQAEQERTYQHVQDRVAEEVRQAGETERARSYYAYLASAANARPPAASGTDHNGGITGALALGFGVGWPALALGALLVVSAALGLLYRLGLRVRASA